MKDIGMQKIYIVLHMNKTNQYIQHSYTGEIFKVYPQHLLKLSPWKDGEDRRIKEYVEDNYRVITYKNACVVVNNQFDNTVEKWTKNGKNYIANAIGSNKNVEEYSYLLSTLPNHSITIESNDGASQLKMIRHKGKIYYILILNEYLPRVKAYNVMGEFCQWIGIDHCKPIFNATDMKYL